MRAGTWRERGADPGLSARRAGGARALLAGLLLVLLPTARAVDPAGRYRISPVDTGEGEPAAGGAVTIAARRHIFVVDWQTAGRRRQRGLALRDGEDLLGVSINTGGRAYGVAIYRREGNRWRGPWITSLDAGGAPGEISFDGAPGGELAGRHRLTGRRGGVSGGFEGAVTIVPKGEDYLLTFTVGGATVYRGLGVRRGERLVVGWSFGSSPALAVYQATTEGGLSGRSLSLGRSGELKTVGEELARAAPGEEIAPGEPILVLPPAIVEPDDDFSTDPFPAPPAAGSPPSPPSPEKSPTPPTAGSETQR